MVHCPQGSSRSVRRLAAGANHPGVDAQSRGIRGRRGNAGESPPGFSHRNQGQCFQPGYGLPARQARAGRQHFPMPRLRPEPGYPGHGADAASHRRYHRPGVAGSYPGRHSQTARDGVRGDRHRNQRQRISPQPERRHVRRCHHTPGLYLAPAALRRVGGAVRPVAGARLAQYRPPGSRATNPDGVRHTRN